MKVLVAMIILSVRLLDAREPVAAADTSLHRIPDHQRGDDKNGNLLGDDVTSLGDDVMSLCNDVMSLGDNVHTEYTTEQTSKCARPAPRVPWSIAPLRGPSAPHPPGLLEYLVGASPASHIIVITNQETGSGASDAAIAGHASRHFLTLSWFSCGHVSVREINVEAQLTRLTAVLVMCSSVDTLTLFQQIRNNSLEDRHVWWAVLTKDQTLLKQLEMLLREGIQMALAIREPETDHYTLYRAEVKGDNKVRLTVLIRWLITPGVFSSSNTFDHIYQDPNILYQNFNARKLTISALPTITFFNYTTLDNGTLVPEGGIDVEIVAILSKVLNFTYRIEEPKEKVWGGPQKDGSVTGLIGHVAKRRAHFSICKITITNERESVIDFSVAYFTEGYAVVSRAPAVVGESKSIIKPFSLLVWALFIITVLLMGPVAFVMDRLGSAQKLPYLFGLPNPPQKEYKGWNPRSIGGVKTETLTKEEKLYRKFGGRLPARMLPVYSFNLFKSIVSQGNDLVTSVDSVRLVFLAWYLFGLVLTCTYSAVLTAGYAVPTYSKTLDSLEEVVAAGKRKEVIPLLNYQNSMDTMFKSSAPGTLYRAIIDLYVPGVTYNFSVNSGERYEAVKKGGYTSFNSYADARALTLQNGRFNFHIGKELFYFQNYGIVLPSGAPYKGVFDDALLRIVEAGLPDKFLDERLKQLLGVKLFMQEAFVKTVDLTTSSIRLTHTQGAFYLVIAGGCIGFLVLLMEICLAKCSYKDH